ncbi:hypothetical protein BaRGS_00016899 [Batillaria attramentaria]|uniref:RING-type domain-containing protein n=1 Tax=Batillaria attramentaria TaxID=370345 RepID=A0ABD0KXT5_9CAEN
MDHPPTTCKTREDGLKRLSTFGRWPIQSGLCSGITNSPSKFAGAYFERKDGAVADEVYCRDCGVTFSNWNNDNPVAVHRVISPKCPALNTPPADDSDFQSPGFLENMQENPFRDYLPSTVQRQLGSETPSSEPRRVALNRVRRQLFASDDSGPTEVGCNDSESASEGSGTGSDQVADTASVMQDSPRSSSVLNRMVIKHPFKPVTGNYDDLFASVRQKTYPGECSQQNQAWAEEGFVLHGDGSVRCDVCSVGDMQYPHYEKAEVRKESFENWPTLCSSVFPADLMCAAGFYYSGCTDKVICFTCGIELYKWQPEADVWQHHAKLSPTCQFVVSHMDQQRIQEAADIQILTDVKYPAVQNGIARDNGAVVPEEIGTPTLDKTAVQAAFACCYPNQAILLASLKAADENHGTICEQQQVIHKKDTALQEKDTALQEKDTALQEKDTQLQTVIQEKDTALQEKDTALQEKDTALQEKDTALQEKDTALQEKDTQLQTVIQEKDTQLQRVIQDKQEKDTQLTQQEAQLRMQDQQIRSLMQQVQQLRADRHPQNPAVPVPGPDGDGAQPGANMGSHQRLLCKICLTGESNMIFLPCGHLVSCVKCASRLPNRRCPICRQDIAEILPAFVV